jgi:LysR family transcriptional regulator, glycine cleavage system transcriptional activator
MFPPFASLRAFEAVSRHLSVTRAAAELRISQPAVSQHLRQLEAHLGVRLLLRGGRRIDLTAEGRAYAEALARGFAEIRAGTERCLAARRGGVLTVAMPSTLAMRWLIPRLAGFHGRHPGIEVRLVTISLPHAAPAAGPPEGVDLEIRSGEGPWPGCRADFLMPDESFPVAAPSLLANRPLRRPADLAGHTLLSVEAEPRSGDWALWLGAAGCPGLSGAGRLGFGSSAQALEAACAGLGVAMGHRPFVAGDLAAGRLAAPFDIVVPGPEAYWLVSRAGDADLPRVRAFRDWLLAEPGCGASAVAESR